MEQRPESSHRSVPHTADALIEAWAPSREQCVAEAVDRGGCPAADGGLDVRLRMAEPDRVVSVDAEPVP
jgi:hypothetical protein